MEKLSNWLEKTNLTKIFIVSWFVFTLLFGTMLYATGKFINTSPLWGFSLMRSFIGGFIFGGVFASMVLCTVNLGRLSASFWEDARELDKLINEADDKETLQKLYKEKFEELKKKSFGGIHRGELLRLHATMTTKYKYVK